MPEPVIGVVGAGRLGRAVRTLATAEARVVRLYDPRDTGSWHAVPAPDVILDCSAPALTGPVADLCRDLALPLVECVSGHSGEQLERLSALGGRTTVVLAHNLSLGNYLQTRALRCVADVLVTMERAGLKGVVPEAAILERHPVTKAHRPSATAQTLAREWSQYTGSPAADVASLRSGPAVSDHEVRLVWAGQALTVAHAVHSLDAAAAGAIGVADWAAGRSHGTYTVHEVFDHMMAAMASRPSAGGHAEEHKAAHTAAQAEAHAAVGERP
ncbi:dihydrodipicolinate reductase C-terminal domain-containing protein [Streptomyces sp. NPDC018000]|uniref:dihydrodipicolinate reductase C-terminal domain-containing protein n=1 Tax=Streptomyces sp. NPDC018000 TaxID=3365028 RepID=UPI0037B9ED72